MAQVEELKKDLVNFPEITILVHEPEFKNLINGEIMLTGTTKATGIEQLLTHCSKSMDDTVSFGDSLNDMEMIATTDLGICMGNGVDALKQIADDVTDTVVNDGIYNAFAKYKII